MADKRRVGLALCAASAVLMLAFGMVIADNLILSKTTDVANETHESKGYRPAGLPD